MTKLILATESFPYGRGEKTFILPEIERLRQYYDITIISHASREQVEEGMCEELPEGIRVMCPGRPRLTGFDKVKALISIFLDRDGRMELKEILEGRRNQGERFYQSLAFYAQSLADQKKLRQSDILTVNEPMIYYSFWCSYFCYSMVREKRRYPDVHIVTRTHGVDLYHERIPGGRQPFKHQMEKSLDAILFACGHAKQYYCTNIRKSVDDGRLYVCRLGTEKMDVPGEYRRPDAWQMVSCSNVIPLKRVPLIIDALAMIEKEKIHWTHIGDGEQMQYVEQYAKEKLTGKDNIKYNFTGYMENSKVIQHYKEHWVDCFITTSSAEGGCPVSAQEAMKFGIPMIGTAVGGITEMIQGNGILLSPDPTDEEIAAAIGKMISYDGETIGAMRDAAIRLWEREFDAESNTRSVLKILKNAEYAD